MANQRKPILPLLLEKKPVELVKPSKHTHCETLSLSTLDNDPFNEVMYATIYVFKANGKNLDDPVSLLRKALSSLFYTLSVTETINIRAGDIKRLKDSMMKECEYLKESFTTYEVLSSYIWKLRSRALKLNPDGITVLGVAVGIRHVLDPPLPKGYYGNAYIDVYVELTVRELEESSISNIANRVKKAKKTAYEKGYIEEELKNTERLMRDDSMFEGVSDGLFFLTDWRNIGWFGSMDFGWNEPVNLRPLTQRESTVHVGMILKPSKSDPSMEGGVKVIMKLPRDAMVEFKREMATMKKLYFGDTN
ncbi:Spermidine coumaroyl-CoA acyltransferase [Arabidopsis thaliana]|uniref:HXXXD-type acyl-transferase family protein n=1 Tax=Arabidopsis thaliana TaxID=3702 RepID=A0A178VW18_ARATH|nr:hypothetical protein AXX17_AT2G20880 [Arabidopsis thaliana]